MHHHASWPVCKPVKAYYLCPKIIFQVEPLFSPITENTKRQDLEMAYGSQQVTELETILAILVF